MFRSAHEQVSVGGGIYCIRNSVNGCYYIGSAKNFRRRFRQHLTQLRHGTHGNRNLQNDFTKFGESAFVFDVIESRRRGNLVRENAYLQQCCRDSFCYNIRTDAFSGVYGCSPSAITREKIRVALTGKKYRGWGAESRARAKIAQLKRHKVNPHSLVTRQKISATLMGNCNAGRPRKQWTLADAERLMFEAHEREKRKLNGEHFTWRSCPQKWAGPCTGRKAGPPTAETRAKISAANRGKRRTPEQRARVSAAMRGKCKSPEHRAKLRENLQKRRDHTDNLLLNF